MADVIDLENGNDLEIVKDEHPTEPFLAHEYVYPTTCIVDNMPYCLRHSWAAAVQHIATRDTFRAHGYPVAKFEPVWRQSANASGKSIVMKFETGLDKYWDVFRLEALFEWIGNGKGSDQSKINPCRGPHLWVATPTDAHYLPVAPSDALVPNNIKNPATASAYKGDIYDHHEVLEPLLQLYPELMFFDVCPEDWKPALSSYA